MIPMHVHAHIVYDTRHSVAAYFDEKDYSICDILSDNYELIYSLGFFIRFDLLLTTMIAAQLAGCIALHHNSYE